MAKRVKGRKAPEALVERVVPFEQRRGPPTAFSDEFQRAEIDKTRTFLEDMRAELLGVASAPANRMPPTPNTSTFFACLARVNNRVTLNAAEAFVNTAVKHGAASGQVSTDNALQSAAVPLGAVSYIETGTREDDGRSDRAKTAQLMQQSVATTFRRVVRGYRSNTQEGAPGTRRRANSTAGELPDAPDDVAAILRAGQRFLALYERALEMQQSVPDGDAAMAKVPTAPPYAHADASYHRLNLGSDIPFRNMRASSTARRRWWWAYMLSSLLVKDMGERKGPTGPLDRALLEVAEFLAVPVAFASNPKRHWIVTGPPGAGKTTFVRFMSVMYHLLGLYPLGTINDETVVMRKVSDMIAGYEGQTRLRTRDLLISHIGMPLPIDEAYALVPAREGETSEYGQEAVDQLVASLLEYGPLIGVFLIGYSTRVVDRLLRANEGMPRRFPRNLLVPEYTAKDLAGVLRQLLVSSDTGFKKPLDAMNADVVGFFEFITGARGTFHYTLTGPPRAAVSVTLTRSVYVPGRRPDESEDDYQERASAARKSTHDGNYFEAENASGIGDIVDELKRRKITPALLTLHDIVERTRALLVQHNVIEYAPPDAPIRPRPEANEDGSTRSSESSDEST